MPVRFTTPSLGGQGELQMTELAAHRWRIAVGYRHLHADQLFVGTQVVATNQPLIITSDKQQNVMAVLVGTNPGDVLAYWKTLTWIVD